MWVMAGFLLLHAVQAVVGTANPAGSWYSAARTELRACGFTATSNVRGNASSSKVKSKGSKNRCYVWHSAGGRADAVGLLWRASSLF